MLVALCRDRDKQTCLFSEAEVSSTSLIREGRTKLAGSIGGVFVADEGYPNEPFVGVLELLGSIPFALSIASRSLPGTEGAEGTTTGVCCVCGKVAWTAGGVEVFC